MSRVRGGVDTTRVRDLYRSLLLKVGYGYVTEAERERRLLQEKERQTRDRRSRVQMRKLLQSKHINYY